MDFDSLRYFVCVCVEGTLTRAADRLCVTQQAVSRKIIMLEDELGVRLFLRTARGMVATAAAARLRAKADVILKEMNGIRADVFGPTETCQTTLKMGFSPGTLFSLGVAKMSQLMAGYGATCFEMAEYSDSQCETLVTAGDLDFAITIHPESHKGLVYLSLLRDDFVVLAGEEHPLAQAGGKGVQLSEVTQYPLIVLDHSFRMQSMLSERFRRLGLTPKVHTSINHDLNVAYDIVAALDAVFIFVKGLVRPGAGQKIRGLPLLEPDLVWDIGIVCRDETLDRFPVIGQLAEDYRRATVNG